MGVCCHAHALSLSVRLCRMLQRVAVIVAGAAGLCAARHILARPNVFAAPVVFELSDSIGGTWCYHERVGMHDNGRPVLSSMYRDLRYRVVALLPSGNDVTV